MVIGHLASLSSHWRGIYDEINFAKVSLNDAIFDLPFADLT